MPVTQTEELISDFRQVDDSSLKNATDIIPVCAATTKIARNTFDESNNAHVAVLLCTYHGDRFLAEQLDSIAGLDHKNLSLWVSDDGSTDDTHQILNQYQSKWRDDRFSIRSGPQKGFAANFLSLVCSSDIQADYIAFADQDDIWDPDKLSRAIEKLKSVPDDTPALYCARTRLVDEGKQDIGFSPLFNKPPSFANALIQNIGSGNTMVMNKAAHEVMRSAGVRDAVCHDWWAYMIITGTGGKVIYDPFPSIKYRQHDKNIIGDNASWLDRLSRIRILLKGQYRTGLTVNINALNTVSNLLTPESQFMLNEFCNARNNWLMPRIWGIYKSRVYRQTFMGNLGLIAATLLKKI